jgi:hypothetical protein
MKRRSVLLRTLGLIVVVLVAIGLCGVGVANACVYDCVWETACVVRPGTPGCEQHFGLEFLVGGMPVCFEQCSNPCSINCVK